MMARRWLTVLGVMGVAACGRGREEPQGMPGMDTGAMAGMAMPSMQMMAGMRAHMDSMRGMSPAQMQGMMGAHQDMMSRMMDAMGSDMRGMNMTATPEWTALADSVRQDLAELPNLTGPALSDRVKSHAERVRRLLAMHERMMGR